MWRFPLETVDSSTDFTFPILSYEMFTDFMAQYVLTTHSTKIWSKETYFSLVHLVSGVIIQYRFTTAISCLLLYKRLLIAGLSLIVFCLDFNYFWITMNKHVMYYKETHLRHYSVSILKGMNSCHFNCHESKYVYIFKIKKKHSETSGRLTDMLVM